MALKTQSEQEEREMRAGTVPGAAGFTAWEEESQRGKPRRSGHRIGGLGGTGTGSRASKTRAERTAECGPGQGSRHGGV